MGNNSWIHPAFFSRHLVEQNVPNRIFGCYFLNMVFDIFSIFAIFSILSQIPNALSFRKKEFQDNHGWSRIENPMSKHSTNFQILEKLCEQMPTCFQIVIFAEIWVSKNPGFVHGCSKNFPSMDFPPHGFPTSWIWDFRGGRGSGRQKPRLETKIGNINSMSLMHA